MSDGFFKKEDLQISKPRLASREGCGGCGLHKHCDSPKLEAHGDGDKGILIIGECPGPEEDKRGKTMVGDSATMLRKVMRRNGIDLDRDCLKINAISCHPGTDKRGDVNDVTDNQINFCRPRVWNTINKFKPTLIILLGTAAVQSFLGHRWTKNLDGINKWRGWTIPDRDVQAWVCPTFHPAFVLRTAEKNAAASVIFEQDIQRALSMLDKPFPSYRHEKDCVKIIEGRELFTHLKRLSESETAEIAFDLEDTGLKPHAPGHKIVTCAIAEAEDYAYAFNMPTDKQTLHYFQRVMSNPSIKKIAHNLKHEKSFIEHLLKIDVLGWTLDTMQASHIIDNRKSVNGLKFQVYVRFGILPYDEHIEPFLKGVEDKNANSLNRVEEAPRHSLLFYNGCDALFTYRLALIQRQELTQRGLI